MKLLIAITTLLLITACEEKNVVVMVPDGTILPTLSTLNLTTDSINPLADSVNLPLTRLGNIPAINCHMTGQPHIDNSFHRVYVKLNALNCFVHDTMHTKQVRGFIVDSKSGLNGLPLTCVTPQNCKVLSDNAAAVITTSVDMESFFFLTTMNNSTLTFSFYEPVFSIGYQPHG